MNEFNLENKKNSVFVDNMKFWKDFYSRHSLRHEPSPFAVWCLERYFGSVRNILELGCGNGRDSFLFINEGMNVLAVDGCGVIIEDNASHLEKLGKDGRHGFVEHDLGNISTLPGKNMDWFEGDGQVDAVYSRFFIHAIPEAIEDSILDFCLDKLKSGGLMLHEFRTLHDPLSTKGKKISDTERWTDHYRRFIDLSEFRKKLCARGWQEVYVEEGAGLAPFGEEDPVVARVVYRKPI